MTRLQSELHRLYLPLPRALAEGEAPSPTLIDPSNSVRAMVFELTQPASWAVLSKVWHGVQTDLGLPAPAVAVSGVDSLQIWFSLAEPVAVAQAHAFLACLQARFLPEIEPGRVRLMPSPQALALRHERHARLIPALQAPSENWSAFVAPDLAAMFIDTPWLDIQPNEEGQAALLCDLASIKRPLFEAALKSFGPNTDRSRQTGVAATHETPAPAGPDEDPKGFLLRIMNDDTVTLALRIEAAKALLQYSTEPHRSRAD